MPANPLRLGDAIRASGTTTLAFCEAALAGRPKSLLLDWFTGRAPVPRALRAQCRAALAAPQSRPPHAPLDPELYAGEHAAADHARAQAWTCRCACCETVRPRWTA